MSRLRALVENLALKVISLILAVLLWLVIAGEQTSEIGLLVPLELHNLPRDLELVGDTVNSVDVRVRASPGIIQRLNRGEISVQLDLRDAVEGEHIYHLTDASIRRPFGLTVVKVRPASLTLTLDRTTEKLVPVVARLVGQPRPGLEVADTVVNPTTVRLAGPRGRMAAVQHAFTESVSIENAGESVTHSVSIGVNDPLLRILGSPRVQVVVRIRDKQQERVFGGLRIELRGERGFVRPSQVSVVLRGPATLLGKVTAQAIRPYVSGVPAGRPGTGLVAVELAPGHTGVSVARVEPSEVALVITKRR